MICYPLKDALYWHILYLHVAWFSFDKVLCVKHTKPMRDPYFLSSRGLGLLTKHLPQPVYKYEHGSLFYGGTY